MTATYAPAKGDGFLAAVATFLVLTIRLSLVLARYFAGRNPWGDEPDNAMWSHAADRDLAGRPESAEKLLRPPLWEISLPRIVGVLIPGMLLLVDPAGAACWEGLFVATVCVVFGDRLRRWLYGRRVSIRAVTPAGKALREALDRHIPARRFPNLIDIPDGWTLDLASVPADERVEIPPVRINFEPGWIDGEGRKKRVESMVGGVLGLSHPRTQWNLATVTGEQPHLLIWPAIMPPDEVTLAELRPYMDKAKPDKPVLALDAHRQPVGLNLSTGYPHWCISAMTDSGKSELYKVRGCQRLRNGVPLIIFDTRGDSHAWAIDLPGVLYVTDIEAIHRTLCAIGAGMWNRINGPRGPDRRILDYPEVDPVFEEANDLADELSRWWVDYRSRHSGQGLPVQSPAVHAMQQCFTKGRRPGIRATIIAVRASAHVFGSNGGDIRENVSEKWLNRPSKNTHNMLAAPGIPYQMWPGNQQGMWQAMNAQESTFAQAALLTDDEARGIALEGDGAERAAQVLVDFLDWGSIEPGGDPVPADILDEVRDDPGEVVTLTEARTLLPGPPISRALLLKFASPNGDARLPDEAQFPEPLNPEAGPGIAKRYIKAQLDVWKIAWDKSRGITSEPVVPGVVYGLVCRYVEDPAKVGIRYVGQSGREAGMEKRLTEHRRDKPWAGLIVNAVPLWQGNCTDRMRLKIEQSWIHKLQAQGLADFNGGYDPTVSGDVVSPPLELVDA